MTDHPWQTRRLPDAYDVLAPDGSEIRLLAEVSGGSTVHCTLPSGSVTQAVRHRTVEETWFFLSGDGVVSRTSGGPVVVVHVHAAAALAVPPGGDYKFRTVRDQALTSVITIMPAWLGEDEAVAIDGVWQPSVGRVRSSGA